MKACVFAAIDSRDTFSVSIHHQKRLCMYTRARCLAGIAPGPRGKLTEYAEDVAVHFANKKREELLMAARDLMTCDSIRYREE